MSRWLDRVRSLGEALLEVLRAELAALQGDLQRSARHLGTGSLLLAGAAVLAFWSVGLVLFVLVTILAVWLPIWGAALVVLGIFLAGTALLVWRARRHLREIESPVATVHRRLDDHLAWWRQSFLARRGGADYSPGAPETPAAEDDDGDFEDAP